MRIIRIMLAALAMLASPAALAQPSDSVTIRANESVSLRVGPSGELSVENRAPNPPLRGFNREVAQRFVGGEFDDVVGDRTAPVSPNDPTATVEPIAPGLIRISFFRLPTPARNAFLVIENGYDRGLVYRAQMRRGDREAPTDVCLVMPMRGGFEHWPYQIDELVLSSLRLVPWQESDGIPCE